MVALAGSGSGGSRRPFTGDRHCVTAGISVISGHYPSSANADAGPAAAYTDTGPANAANGDAGTTHAPAPDAGASTNHGGALPAYPDAGTTYSAGTRVSDYADDVSNTGDITSPDPYATTPSPDADAATGHWG